MKGLILGSGTVIAFAQIWLNENPQCTVLASLTLPVEVAVSSGPMGTCQLASALNTGTTGGGV